MAPRKSDLQPLSDPYVVEHLDALRFALDIRKDARVKVVPIQRPVPLAVRAPERSKETCGGTVVQDLTPRAKNSGEDFHLSLQAGRRAR